MEKKLREIVVYPSCARNFIYRKILSSYARTWYWLTEVFSNHSILVCSSQEWWLNKHMTFGVFNNNPHYSDAVNGDVAASVIWMNVSSWIASCARLSNRCSACRSHVHYWNSMLESNTCSHRSIRYGLRDGQSRLHSTEYYSRCEFCVRHLEIIHSHCTVHAWIGCFFRLPAQCLIWKMRFFKVPSFSLSVFRPITMSIRQRSVYLYGEGDGN